VGKPDDERREAAVRSSLDGLVVAAAAAAAEETVEPGVNAGVEGLNVKAALTAGAAGVVEAGVVEDVETGAAFEGVGAPNEKVGFDGGAFSFG
jgi:hypothetical protein